MTKGYLCWILMVPTLQICIAKWYRQEQIYNLWTEPAFAQLLPRHSYIQIVKSIAIQLLRLIREAVQAIEKAIQIAIEGSSLFQVSAEVISDQKYWVTHALIVESRLRSSIQGLIAWQKAHEASKLPHYLTYPIHRLVECIHCSLFYPKLLNRIKRKMDFLYIEGLDFLFQ